MCEIAPSSGLSSGGRILSCETNTKGPLNAQSSHPARLVLVGVIENRRLPVLNQGQSDLAITMSGKRDRVIGHPKTILVATKKDQQDYLGSEAERGLADIRKPDDGVRKRILYYVQQPGF